MLFSRYTSDLHHPNLHKTNWQSTAARRTIFAPPPFTPSLNLPHTIPSRPQTFDADVEEQKHSGEVSDTTPPDQSEIDLTEPHLPDHATLAQPAPLAAAVKATAPVEPDPFLSPSPPSPPASPRSQPHPTHSYRCTLISLRLACARRLHRSAAHMLAIADVRLDNSRRRYGVLAQGRASDAAMVWEYEAARKGYDAAVTLFNERGAAVARLIAEECLCTAHEE